MGKWRGHPGLDKWECRLFAVSATPVVMLEAPAQTRDGGDTENRNNLSCDWLFQRRPIGR